MLQTKPTDTITETRFVTLRARSGDFLDLSGTRLVADRKIAYRGTPDQALRMRDRVDPAWGLSIIPYSNIK